MGQPNSDPEAVASNVEPLLAHRAKYCHSGAEVGSLTSASSVHRAATQRIARDESVGMASVASVPQPIRGPDVSYGSWAPFSRSPGRIRSTSDLGKIATAQRADVEGQQRTSCSAAPSRHLAFLERAFRPTGKSGLRAELTSSRSCGRRRLRSARRTTRRRPWRRGVGAPDTSGRGSGARARRMNGERGTR